MQAPKENVKDPDELTSWVSSMAAATPIAAGSTVRFSALLNDLYDMTAPGAYTIHVRKLVSGPDPAIAVESNVITVKVTEQPSPTVILVLTTDAKRFSFGSDTDADLSATNISSLPIRLPFNLSRPNAEQNGFKFVGFAAGSSADSPTLSKFEYWWRRYDDQYPTEKTIQSNQTVHYPVRLSRLLDIGARGTYTIRAEGVDPVTHLSVKSNALGIRVQ